LQTAKPHAPKVIALIGLPGSGKTTIGRLLARRLGFAFIDTDHRIEEVLGCSIRAYFEAQGEEAFRDVESRVLEELTGGDACVLSTGGGIVLRPQNRARLHSTCHVVYLKSLPEELIHRLRGDSKRPLLQVDDPLARLRSLYEQRAPLYQETAHTTLETARRKVHSLVALLAAQFELQRP